MSFSKTSRSARRAIETTNTSPSAARNQSEGRAHARIRIPRGQLLIDGTWRDAEQGETMPNFDPTTELETTQVAKGSPSDADAAVQAAARAFEDGPWGR